MRFPSVPDNRLRHPRLSIRRVILPLILTGFVSFGFRPVSVDKANVALGGYDTVAYFTAGKAVKGSAIYAVESSGAMWRFSSLTNMRLFKANPSKYMPAFGGYCSYAISKGDAVSCDPEAFLIRNGRLYAAAETRRGRVRVDFR